MTYIYYKGFLIMNEIDKILSRMIDEIECELAIKMSVEETAFVYEILANGVEEITSLRLNNTGAGV
jgi:hypothetical protein